MVAVFSALFAVFLFASRGECAQVTPDLAHLLAPEPPALESDPLLQSLYIQEKEVIEQTHRKVEVMQPEGEQQYTQKGTEKREVPGPPQAMPAKPLQLGLRLGMLLPVHSRRISDELLGDPDSAGLFGLVASSPRIPVPPYGWSKWELSFDMNMFGMDIKYDGAAYDTIYEDYFDIILSYLLSLFPRPDISSCAYCGVGVGWARETIRYNPTPTNPLGTTPWHETNDSAVFQFKLGWDSGRGVFVEACYKKLLDSDRNIDNMWGLVIGFSR